MGRSLNKSHMKRCDMGDCGTTPMPGNPMPTYDYGMMYPTSAPSGNCGPAKRSHEMGMAGTATPMPDQGQGNSEPLAVCMIRNACWDMWNMNNYEYTLFQGLKDNICNLVEQASTIPDDTYYGQLFADAIRG